MEKINCTEQSTKDAAEIIKALRHCSDPKAACSPGQKENECPYFMRGLIGDANKAEYCDDQLKSDAAELIEQQIKEISSLRTANSDQAEKLLEAAKGMEALSRELEAYRDTYIAETFPTA